MRPENRHIQKEDRHNPMTKEISKNFDFAQAEEEVTKKWLEKGSFSATPDDRDNRYVVMMPLPNVTGALHMGHAMDNVMQDLLVRWHRMDGDNTLWQPGTDHAGIATQAVVEKRLLEFEGKTRHDLGREKLVEKIWDWTDTCQKRIISQQQRMGCSCDWSRQRFTIDDVCKSSVRECFYRLFKDKLIFRGHRLVNWDCFLQTAVSDDEIVTENIQGHFWHLQYPVIDPQDGEPSFVTVATTRPETMLGDTAIAVHPDPEKELKRLIFELEEKIKSGTEKNNILFEEELKQLKKRITTVLPGLIKLRDMALAGRKIMLPLQERPIPLICDEWAKPSMGSGCVKITPAHDPNDYDVWTRHENEIDIINILNSDGTLNDNGGTYKGIQILEARKVILKDLEERGSLVEIEDREIPIGHSDRSKTPIEPWLSKQWFVNMGDVDGGLTMAKGSPLEFETPGLAQAAIDAVEGKWETKTGRKLTFYPDHDRYANSYLAWLREKRDWCISRQLWWGHRIPIWMNEFTKEEITKLVGALHNAAGTGSEKENYWLWISDSRENLVSASEIRNLADEGTYELQLCFRDEESESQYAAIISDFKLKQDNDVLDTWFSSALWPFSTQGWPNPEKAKVNPGQPALGASKNQQSALDYYYPGSCLVTGRDIISLWVARMAIMGLYNLGDLPFTDCFIHANIQDGKGERMSKSKGNGIDPVDIIEQYGTDALRYVVCDMQSGTQDIRLPVQAISPFTGELIELAEAKHGRSIFTYICPHSGKEFDVLGTIDELPGAKLISNRFETGRAFCTKLWNGARFAFMSLDNYKFEPVSYSDLESEDKWILSKMNKAIAEVTDKLKSYNPSAAIGAARDFFRGELCGWYIELIKGRLKDENKAPMAQMVLSLVLDNTFRLFHPFIPFITEELWTLLNEYAPQRGLEKVLECPEMVIEASWPKINPQWDNNETEATYAILQDAIRSIRDIKAKYQIPPKTKVSVIIKTAQDTETILRPLESHLLSQAVLEKITFDSNAEKPKNSATAVAGDMEIYVENVLDPVKELKRLNGQKEKLEKLLAATMRKLNNPKFVDSAPASVVEEEKRREAESKAQLLAIEEGIKSLA
jgi:valyl-tRNA synthetase